MTKYKGLFNYYQQVFELYTTVEDETKAFNNFITQLSKKIKVKISIIRWYFNEDVDNFSIEKVKEG